MLPHIPKTYVSYGVYQITCFIRHICVRSKPTDPTNGFCASSSGINITLNKASTLIKNLMMTSVSIPEQTSTGSVKCRLPNNSHKAWFNQWYGLISGMV